MPTLPPIPDNFTHAIATRAFTVLRHGAAFPLQVDIGQPVQDVETVNGTDWRCPVRWIDSGVVRVHGACGVDALQALGLAMAWLQQELIALADEEGVRLHFLGSPYDARTQRPEVAALRGRGAGARPGTP